MKNTIYLWRQYKLSQTICTFQINFSILYNEPFLTIPSSADQYKSTKKASNSTKK